jgi:hypothetical protein
VQDAFCGRFESRVRHTRPVPWTKTSEQRKVSLGIWHREIWRRTAAALPINPIRIVMNGWYPPSLDDSATSYAMPSFESGPGTVEVTSRVAYICKSRTALIMLSEVSAYRTVSVDQVNHMYQT